MGSCTAGGAYVPGKTNESKLDLKRACDNR